MPAVNEDDTLLSVELVDVDVLHDLVGEASEVVTLVEAFSHQPKPHRCLTGKIFGICLVLVVQACQSIEP